jgi:PBP1b-binding outer membrane lipoprotein LpoB
MKHAKNYRLLLGALLTAIAVALTGCSSVKTKVDTGPVKARSFSFITPPAPPANNTAPVHAMIQDAITRNLASKGLNHVQSGGDVTVAYLVIAGNNAETTSFADYFGSTGDAYDLLDKVHNAETVGSDRRDYFQAGTLFIDVVNPQTSKLLWRGSTQRDILQNPTPQVRAERIQEAVDSTLQPLRISP